MRSAARRHGLDASLLYSWRRAFLADRLAQSADAAQGFVPVQLALPAPTSASPTMPPGSIEVLTAGGHHGRIVPRHSSSTSYCSP